jgi:REP element-mobilizing transposase RayT
MPLASQHKPGRRSIRLPAYDYTRLGSYFVTICARDGECLFGKIIKNRMALSEMGQIVADCWHQIPAHFPHVELDVFVVMPNHVHGILMIVRATHASPLPQTQTSSLRPCGPRKGSLGAIVGSFKSAVTRHINQSRNTSGNSVWQRNYYEHAIRNEIALNRIRDYIQTNPTRWALDRENPNRRGPDDFDLWLNGNPT